MSLLRDIEQKIEGLFERGFRRAFRSSLQPVELARKLAREMEDHKTVSVSRVYVPNDFTVYLSPGDREGFASYERSLTTELGSYLDAHARGAGLSLVAPAVVALSTDEDLRPGEFGIACRMADPPEQDAPPATVAAEPRPELPGPPAAPPVVEPPRPNSALEGVSGTQVISAADARDSGLRRETMTLVVGTTRTRLSERVSTMGRSRECHVVVPDANASRTHAEIRHIGLDYYLVDMGSTNGTEVNGQIVKRHALADGDVIVIGTTEIKVELSDRDRDTGVPHVNETGLIVAEVAFLALLYAFVWTVVRSSSRQLRAAQPPRAGRADAPPQAVEAAPLAPAPPPPAPVAVAPPAPAPARDAPEDATAGDWQEDPDRIELHGNLDPRLVVQSSEALEVGRVIALEGGMTIGRSEGAGISLGGDQFASHMHARIRRRGAYHFVEDLGSTNGTFLNDRRIAEDAQLKVHDELRIGQTILRYEE